MLMLWARQGAKKAPRIKAAVAGNAKGPNLIGSALCSIGSGGGIRTPDPAVNSRLLYH
jgi:hypothetical protein